MSIIQHNYQNNLIFQTSSDIKLAGKFIPKGYTNATAMCKANGKLWGTYWKTQKAQSFANAVKERHGLDESVISIQGGDDPTIQGTWVHIEVANHLLTWLQENNKECKHNKSEAKVRDRLASSINGKTEIVTPVGNIDVLTSTQIIEIKDAKSWKCALGQVIAYGHYYPSHKKRIHLFNKEYSQSKSIIEDICKKQDVIVTWE